MGPTTPQDNPLIPPGQANPLLPPGMPPPLVAPPPSPALGFQPWAGDPRNALKVQPAMVAPGAPLQPNAQMASANPPQPTPMASSAPPSPSGAPPLNVSTPSVLPSAQGAAPGPIPAMPDNSTARIASAMTPPAVQSQLGADTGELQRLQKTGSGISQVKNPWLKGLGMAGDFAASALLGKGAAAIPGTTAHNNYLQEQQIGRIGQDQTANAGLLTGQQNAANLAHTKAETASLGSNTALKAQTGQVALAKAGLKTVLDENGNPSLAIDEDSPAYKKQQLEQGYLQAHTDAVKAQKELRDAQTAYETAKGKPGSPIFQQAQQRLNTAMANVGINQQKLTLANKRFLMQSQGIDENGNAYTGSMLDDNGNPTGTAFQQNVRPTGTERNKADMASSASEQLGTIKDILQKRPDIFGPAAGRTTDFNVWLGSQDPDAQRFRAARTIAGDHLAGTFGGRSEAALSAIDNAIGQFKDNPAAALAGVDQLTKANTRFETAGTVKTAGNKAGGNAMAPPTQTPRAYSQTATGPNGHKIGSNDGKTWFDAKTGKAVK